MSVNQWRISAALCLLSTDGGAAALAADQVYRFYGFSLPADVI